MKATLQEQLAFLQRIINPNYIIIIQNKANEDMDFSRLKINQEPEPEKIKPLLRFNIRSIDHPEKEGYKIVIVEDNFYNNRSVYERNCKIEKLEEELSLAKSKYRGSNIIDKI